MMSFPNDIGDGFRMVSDWLSEHEREALIALGCVPTNSLTEACYAVLFISLVRNSRAPRHLENLMYLACNQWSDMYVQELILGIRTIYAEIYFDPKPRLLIW